MSQSNSDPYHVSNLLQPALNGIVGALADRGDPSGPEYLARCAEVWTTIQSFQPRDSIDLMLVGQLIAFNELLADGTREVLRGMEDAVKPRARSSLIAIGKLTQGHVDRLEERGMKPYQTVLAQPRTEQRASPPTAAPEAQPEPELAAASRNDIAAARGNESDPEITPPKRPAEPASWLDEPYQEWLLETPAMLTAAAALAANALATETEVVPGKAAPPAKVSRTKDTATSWNDEPDASSPYPLPEPAQPMAVAGD